MPVFFSKSARCLSSIAWIFGGSLKRIGGALGGAGVALQPALGAVAGGGVASCAWRLKRVSRTRESRSVCFMASW